MTSNPTAKLLSLFDQREREREATNKQIMELLAPTALRALIQVLDVPTETIQWVDVRVMEGVIVIVFTVTYNPSTIKSTFIRTQLSSSESDIEVEQVMHMSIPISKVFDDVEDIKQFLHRAFVETEHQLVEADTPSLSSEQYQQMLFFQQQTKGSIQ